MTIISTHKRVSNRELFNKAVHAKARKDALRSREALGCFERFLYERCKCSYCIPDSPRQRYFRRSWELAEDTAEPGTDHIYDIKTDKASGDLDGLSFCSDAHSTMTSLIDIARPAKGKRKAKGATTHYAVASKPRHDDLGLSSVLGEEFEIWGEDVYDLARRSADDGSDDEEWEHIESEHKLLSYASIVRGSVG